MGKRARSDGARKSKKFKVGGFIDPHTSGIYATCNRGREQQCRKELMNLFHEKASEWYDLEAGAEESDSELLIEDQIKKEVEGLKEQKREFLRPIDLGCECLVFIKTKRPIPPAEFVERLCKESHEKQVKNTRYTQKLTPVTFSVTPTLDEIKKLAARVLGPHFHAEDQKPVKFAIQVTRRNFNTIEKATIINTVAECVGNDHGHSVDLKNYDKLILVECYKSNVGMAVVGEYERYLKFNLQQLFEGSEGKEQLRVTGEKGGEKKKEEGKKEKKEKGENGEEKGEEEEKKEKEGKEDQ